MKLHRKKVIDENVEISEGQYIHYLIKEFMNVNASVNYNDRIAQEFLSDRIGKLFEYSKNSGEFVEPSMNHHL